MKKLEKFNCIVAIIDGKLKKCQLMADGGPEFWAGSLTWREVKSPVTQDFIDAVNEALGTGFTVESFSKRNSLL